MHKATLSHHGNCFVDLMWTSDDGWWIEEVQPSFSRVSIRYKSEAAARAAWDNDAVEWDND